ncbi:hypothetical protein BIWAKO_06863 [Bosea sp. BIWAKO-01]|nr:hypothetical protein BIWAKO_06863 [Bosea sp. BIWAKO-01]
MRRHGLQPFDRNVVRGRAFKLLRQESLPEKMLTSPGKRTSKNQRSNRDDHGAPKHNRVNTSH